MNLIEVYVQSTQCEVRDVLNITSFREEFSMKPQLANTLSLHWYYSSDYIKHSSVLQLLLLNSIISFWLIKKPTYALYNINVSVLYKI